ncbi:hypothetical protein BDP27DRAFT_1209762, partial [Rhodocollybia butyracea]
IMEHRPRYPQPFTLPEALLLDVSTISEEITRLQYSIKRLRETQEILQDTINEAESPDMADVEIVNAIKENEQVMCVYSFCINCHCRGSQEERILILKLALADKGVNAGPHYDVNVNIKPTGKAPAFNAQDNRGLIEEDDSGGLHL